MISLTYPAFIMHNFPDGTQAYSIASGQLRLREVLRRVEFSNFNNLFPRQFSKIRLTRAARTDSNTCSVSSFFRHVLNIIGSSAFKKMSGINAGGIIAAMTNAVLYSRRLSRGQHISKSMRQIFVSVDLYSTIVSPISTSSPSPTFSRFSDFRPKLFQLLVGHRWILS